MSFVFPKWALVALSDLPITVEDPGRHLMLGGEAARALRYDVTPYDAAYPAVALDCVLPFATANRDLAHAALGPRRRRPIRVRPYAGS